MFGVLSQLLVCLQMNNLHNERNGYCFLSVEVVLNDLGNVETQKVAKDLCFLGLESIEGRIFGYVGVCREYITGRQFTSYVDGESLFLALSS